MTFKKRKTATLMLVLIASISLSACQSNLKRSRDDCNLQWGRADKADNCKHKEGEDDYATPDGGVTPSIGKTTPSSGQVTPSSGRVSRGGFGSTARGGSIGS
ncbi:MAG: hypothetical protein F6K36_18810 [Symploca sp. SIO3C6]|nr:hypothetical protein [Symploca sp. SIO3C6]